MGIGLPDGFDPLSSKSAEESLVIFEKAMKPNRNFVSVQVGIFGANFMIKRTLYHEQVEIHG